MHVPSTNQKKLNLVFVSNNKAISTKKNCLTLTFSKLILFNVATKKFKQTVFKQNCN